MRTLKIVGIILSEEKTGVESSCIYEIFENFFNFQRFILKRYRYQYHTNLIFFSTVNDNCSEPIYKVVKVPYYRTG